MDSVSMRKEYETMRYALDKTLPKECGNCGSEESLQIHHVVPIAFGGTNRISNLVRLCLECHSKAHGGSALIEKATETKRNNVAKGKRTSSTILFGYKYENDEYVIDEDNAEVVRFIFRLRCESELSTGNVAELLNHMAIPTAGSAKEWTHPTVATMLRNPQYLGKREHTSDVYPAVVKGDLAESIHLFEQKYDGKRVPIRRFSHLKKQVV